jgi:hypothetical protein
MIYACVLAALATVEPPSRFDVSIRYDRLTHRFVLRNDGLEPVSCMLTSSKQVMCTVQRLTPEGWVGTFADWCGTGSTGHRLYPGQTIAFNPPLGGGGIFHLLGLDKKYPDFLKYDMRVGVSVGTSGKRVQVWSERMKPPK